MLLACFRLADGLARAAPPLPPKRGHSMLAARFASQARPAVYAGWNDRRQRLSLLVTPAGPGPGRPRSRMPLLTVAQSGRMQAVHGAPDRFNEQAQQSRRAKCAHAARL
jgi:hypothetical protein